jgi:multicomponent Na+:H+ antiporter subunit E
VTLRTSFGRVVDLGVWTFAVWILLTWTPFTVEEEAFGAGLSLAVALAVAPLGPVAAPWRLLTPRRLLGLGRLFCEGGVRIVVANLKLARRIWAPSRPVPSGMVIVPTEFSTPGGLTAVALISSLIVDNQIVDLDVPGRRLQYHAVAVPSGGPDARRAAINGPVERLIEPLVR